MAKNISEEADLQRALGEVKIGTGVEDFEYKYHSWYKSYLEQHKPSEFKYIKDQKEFDGLALSGTLQNIDAHICDYCKTITYEKHDMRNGYHACTECKNNI